MVNYDRLRPGEIDLGLCGCHDAFELIERSQDHVVLVLVICILGKLSYYCPTACIEYNSLRTRKI